ncbi:hypothetical protein [Salmonirosea aquatica]|uniref:Peptidylprolyl isomerase n=1 Tax=Salmonirosea aquatica TaxID=2654236 RepID=A0A7C9BJN1_9BACT|nr:hypothetical protein [Cytophagaceae bacterium SJW1-29]
MKSTKKSFIFAAVLGVILGANPSVSFSESVPNDSSAKAQVLARGSEVEFSTYVKENLPKFSGKADWLIVDKIVTLYSLSPSKLLNTTKADQKAFNEAVKSLNTKLNRQKDEQANQWSRDLQKTVQQIQFIWNFDIDSLTPVFIETPAYVVPATASL